MKLTFCCYATSIIALKMLQVYSNETLASLNISKELVLFSYVMALFKGGPGPADPGVVKSVMRLNYL